MSSPVLFEPSCVFQRLGVQAENAALKKLIEEVVSDSTVAQERVAKLRNRYSHLLHNVRL